MQLNLDGTVTMQCGETEIGQGADTAYAQMTAKAVGLKSYKDVHVVSCQDTDITPTGLGAYASRQTYMEGFAIDQTGRFCESIFWPMQPRCWAVRRRSWTSPRAMWSARTAARWRWTCPIWP